jgi:hypothetical protein
MKQSRKSKINNLAASLTMCRVLQAVLLLSVTLVLPFTVFAQQTSPFDNLISKIQQQEIKFPFPQKDTTILVGEININNGRPTIKYFVPTYPGGSFLCCGEGRERHREGTRIIQQSEDYIPPTRVTVYGGKISIKNYMRFKLRFTIKNWAPPANTLTVRLASNSQTVNSGATEVFFSEIYDTTVPLTLLINGQAPPYDVPVNRIPWYQEPLLIDWNAAGAGIITLPVLPVKIVYAPIVDCRRLNRSSMSNTTIINYGTSISFTTTNSTTTPVPTSLNTIEGVAGDMSAVGGLMASSGDPEIAAIGSGLTTIGNIVTDGIGSDDINRTVSNAVTDQRSLNIGVSNTGATGATASNGGPGDGDVICFYRNAKLLWYAHNGKMQLALVGYEPTLKMPSAKDLKDALESLRFKPKGTKDVHWQIDAVAIQSLLNLDPFTGPGCAKTRLDPTRFSLAHKLDGSAALYQNGGATESIVVTHQTSASDLHSTTSTVSTIETQTAGFLSFLGLGPSEDQMLQMSYSKSATTQNAITQIISAGYDLFGQTGCDDYSCEVYFDNVFGTFAFRDNKDDLESNYSVNGTLYDQNNRVQPNTRVYLNMGNTIMSTMSNGNGEFNFRLPYQAKASQLILKAQSTENKLNFTGSPINKIKLKIQ